MSIMARHRIAALWRAGINLKGRVWAAHGALDVRCYFCEEIVVNIRTKSVALGVRFRVPLCGGSGRCSFSLDRTADTHHFSRRSAAVWESHQGNSVSLRVGC